MTKYCIALIVKGHAPWIAPNKDYVIVYWGQMMSQMNVANTRITGNTYDIKFRAVISESCRIET